MFSLFLYAINIKMLEEKDIYFMRLALEEAIRAEEEDEVPVGAVLVKDGQVIARAHNEVIKQNDPTAHAEILVIRRAAKIIGNYRLLDSELYVTIEPCFMCAGAILHARLKRVVFGTFEPKMGALGSLYNLSEDKRLTHHLEVKGGVLAEEAQRLIQAFFRRRRGTEVAVTGATRNRLVP